jgi:hypothetical protein
MEIPRKEFIRLMQRAAALDQAWEETLKNHEGINQLGNKIATCTEPGPATLAFTAGEMVTLRHVLCLILTELCIRIERKNGAG